MAKGKSLEKAAMLSEKAYKAPLAVGSHDFDSRKFKWRVSSPRRTSHCLEEHPYH